MKKITALMSLAILAGMAAFVSAEDKPADKAPTTAPTTAPATRPAAENGAVNQFCAVEQEHAIDPKGKTTTYKDKVIGFCCDDCIDEFKKNPEKYMAKLK